MFLMKVHAEGWVTIRGAKVFIGGNGKITQGPAKFIGSTLNDLGGKSSPSTAKSSASGSAKTTAPKKEKATTPKKEKATKTKLVELTKSQKDKYDTAIKHGASKSDAMGYADGTHSKRTIEKAIITGKPAKEAKNIPVASDIRVFIPKGWE